ncbi:MAG: LuxR family transcriptional regulator, partial [Actinomycetia bacterium]|nr:LuxR family transcriptional regulator [Actinomycetes bacterium]
MAGTAALDKARDAYAARAWASAYGDFRVADEKSPLAAGDLEDYARAAYLVGEDEATATLLARAFEQHQRARCADAAGEDAFWLGFYLLNRGEFARAGGWLGRANEVTTDHGGDCPVRAKLLAISALQKLMGGDPASALPGFAQAQAVGRDSHDADLMGMAGLGIGQAKIALGEVSAGLVKLDEVMVAVTADEVSPTLSGIVYCAVIVACHQSYQPRRAAEWTRALSLWCEDQPDLALFRGDCLVHRAQILVLNGAWEDATSEVDLACRRLSDPPGQPAIGAAVYERAELHRMRGEFAAAVEAYGRSGELGHEVQP